MIARYAPNVRTLVGGDAPSGWIPKDAVAPLPWPLRTDIFTVRIVNQRGQYLLEWLSHEPQDWSLPSGRGSRSYNGLPDALRAATEIFALEEQDWALQGGERLSPREVEHVVQLELEAHGVARDEIETWGRLVQPPHPATFRIPEAGLETFWLVLESEPYAVSFDGSTGDYGLGVANAGGPYTYVGDYGPLWVTLNAM